MLIHLISACILLSSVVLLLTGIVNPDASLFWLKKKRTRLKSFGIYSFAMLVSAFIFAATFDSSQEQLTKSVSRNTDENLIGKWIDDSYEEPYYILLYRKDGKVFKAMRDESGSVEMEMNEGSLRGNAIYEKAEGNRFGEYYLIGKRGNLEAYDRQGFIEEYKQVNN